MRRKRRGGVLANRGWPRQRWQNGSRGRRERFVFARCFDFPCVSLHSKWGERRSLAGATRLAPWPDPSAGEAFAGVQESSVPSEPSISGFGTRSRSQNGTGKQAEPITEGTGRRQPPGSRSIYYATLNGGGGGKASEPFEVLSSRGRDNKQANYSLCIRRLPRTPLWKINGINSTLGDTLPSVEPASDPTARSKLCLLPLRTTAGLGSTWHRWAELETSSAPRDAGQSPTAPTALAIKLAVPNGAF